MRQKVFTPCDDEAKWPRGLFTVYVENPVDNVSGDHLSA